MIAVTQDEKKLLIRACHALVVDLKIQRRLYEHAVNKEHQRNDIENDLISLANLLSKLRLSGEEDAM